MKRGLVERALHRIARRLPYRAIDGFEGEPYMVRYVVFQVRGRFAIFLHQYLGSDPDRGYHDHPWRWSFGVPLVRGYWEELLLPEAKLAGMIFPRRVFRAPFRMNWINGRKFHRITLDPWTHGGVWSLFVHGRRVKPWGFLRHDGSTPRGGRERWTYEQAKTRPTGEDNLNYPERPFWWLRAKETA